MVTAPLALSERPRPVASASGRGGPRSAVTHFFPRANNQTTRPKCARSQLPTSFLWWKQIGQCQGHLASPLPGPCAARALFVSPGGVEEPRCSRGDAVGCSSALARSLITVGLRRAEYIIRLSSKGVWEVTVPWPCIGCSGEGGGGRGGVYIVQGPFAQEGWP